MARAAGDLLPEFEVSTKVGFFPGRTHTKHSLDPHRLRQALQRSTDELGVRPTVVFLHSPERSLVDLAPEHGFDVLSAACDVLAAAAGSGLCDTWGITSWEPRPVLRALRSGTGQMAPQVVMVRAGLSLDGGQLDAAEALFEVFGVPTAGRWGMSPFAGSTADPAWTSTNYSPFLEPRQVFTPVQAAFRLAYELPRVDRVAVGSTDRDHLDDLATAVSVRIASGAIEQYRKLVAASKEDDPSTG